MLMVCVIETLEVLSDARVAAQPTWIRGIEVSFSRKWKMASTNVSAVTTLPPTPRRRRVAYRTTDYSTNNTIVIISMSQS
jgi:hypothetical protein